MKYLAKDVTELKAATEKRYNRRYIENLKIITGRAMPFLVLVILSTLFIKFSISLTSGQESMIILLDKIVLALFATDLLADYILSNSKRAFFRKRWLSFMLFLPLFNIVGRFGIGTAKLLHCSDIISKGDKIESILRVLESNTLNPALKAGHMTNVGARLARSSCILDKLRHI
ncbi:MAG: hypothetical protein KAR23_00205 [Candidatus Aenigmarchaeota archaeon]|nr:hypothetical protein [Candidatus Aenigmarchaeota archaeon]